MRKTLTAALAALTLGGAMMLGASPADARPCGFWSHGYWHRTACRRVMVAVRPGVVVVRPGVRGGCMHRRWNAYQHRFVYWRGRCWR